MLRLERMARDHREFIIWQLADEVRREVIGFTARTPAKDDWRFVQHIRATADSGCSNFAEGFGRFKHKQFANFVRIARGSLMELIDQLDSAHQRTYIDAETANRLQRLCRRAIGASGRMIKYLESTPDPTGE